MKTIIAAAGAYVQQQEHRTTSGDATRFSTRGESLHSQLIVDPGESGPYADCMSFEVEVKYRAVDHDHLARQLTHKGAVATGAVDQQDVYLSHPARDFAATNEATAATPGRRDRRAPHPLARESRRLAHEVHQWRLSRRASRSYGGRHVSHSSHSRHAIHSRQRHWRVEGFQTRNYAQMARRWPAGARRNRTNGETHEDWLLHDLLQRPLDRLPPRWIAQLFEMELEIYLEGDGRRRSGL